VSHEDKKDLLASIWGPIAQPTTADICTAGLNAYHQFPDQPLHLLHMDIAGAFPRIRTNPDDIPLCTTPILIDGEDFLFFPLSNRFGIQDSNYQWQLVARFFISLIIIRLQLLFMVCGILTDDIFVFGPISLLHTESELITTDAIRFLGPTAINRVKTVLATTATLNGEYYDCLNRTVSLSSTMFLKLVSIFFVRIPIDNPLLVGQLISIPLLQKLQSYVLRCSLIMPAMRSFCRSFSANLAGLPSSARHSIPLSARSVTDIQFWRVILQLAVDDSTWITISWTIPPLLRHFPTESQALRHARQARQADFLLYADACTTNNGIGAYFPGIAWSQAQLISLDSYFDASDQLVPMHINVLEFIAAIVALVQFVQHRLHQGLVVHALHLHIWTDNSSCLSWLCDNRSSHPLHLFLLHVFSLLQVQYGLIVTLGHCPGYLNIYSDAASRYFNPSSVPNAPLLQSQLARLPTLLPPIAFIQRIAQVAKTPSFSPSQQAREALTVLGTITGAPSAPSTA